MDKKIHHFKALQKEGADLYEKKNQDYGDSFSKSFREYGMTMSLIRLEDKLNRAKSLNKRVTLIEDETMEDTLIDMSNYALMTILELREKRGESVDTTEGDDHLEQLYSTAKTFWDTSFRMLEGKSESEKIHHSFVSGAQWQANRSGVEVGSIDLPREELRAIDEFMERSLSVEGLNRLLEKLGYTCRSANSNDPTKGTVIHDKCERLVDFQKFLEEGEDMYNVLSVIKVVERYERCKELKIV